MDIITKLGYHLYSEVEVMRVLRKIRYSHADVVLWPHYITDLSASKLKKMGFSVSRSSENWFAADTFPVNQNKGDTTTIYCCYYLKKGA